MTPELPLPATLDTEYAPPALTVIGTVYEHTLNGGLSGCYWGKQLGGTDGFTFMGISVPISNCST
jgi:hypothetical protein